MNFDPSAEKKVQRLALHGTAFAFAAVLLGAFGAHALRTRISTYSLDIYQTGVYYQMIHALGLFAAAWLLQSYRAPQSIYAGYCFTGGIIIFSGSLYLLALTGIKKWGMVTPIGGLLFLIGWLLLAISILKRKT